MLILSNGSSTRPPGNADISGRTGKDKGLTGANYLDGPLGCRRPAMRIAISMACS
jgi:hypothetical protein